MSRPWVVCVERSLMSNVLHDFVFPLARGFVTAQVNLDTPPRIITTHFVIDKVPMKDFLTFLQNEILLAKLQKRTQNCHKKLQKPQKTLQKVLKIPKKSSKTSKDIKNVFKNFKQAP